MLAELFPGNRFYSSKLHALGLTFDVASLADFSARFPFTTKPEIIQDQLAQPPFGTNLTYPLDRYTRFHQTSGTTGSPLRWLDTPDSWESMLESWLEVHRAAGVRPADRIYFAFSFGPFIGFWLAFESAARLGCLCVPGGGLSSSARLRAILDNEITVLCCTPTYALRLAQTAADEKIDLSRSKVHLLIVAGEPGGSIPAVRQRLSEAWPPARVFDHHGMTEVGPVTYECPAQPGILHVIESAYFAEIIDPATGRPVPGGQIGELVLTTLGRVAMPLLRYKTGDLVKQRVHSPSGSAGAIDSPCACGRYEMSLEGGILGRTDDMVVIRGVNVFPSAVDEIVRGYKGILEYRVEITTERSLTEMRLQVEPAPDCSDTAALLNQLERGFEAALALRVPVTLAAPGSLPRWEMKAARWTKNQKV